MNSVLMTASEITKKTVAIVKFGPASATDGLRPAEYFQVTIDPAMARGDFIRFGANQGDEIMGWQRLGAITIVQVLGEWIDGSPPEMEIGESSITMMAVTKE